MHGVVSELTIPSLLGLDLVGVSVYQRGSIFPWISPEGYLALESIRVSHLVRHGIVTPGVMSGDVAPELIILSSSSLHLLLFPKCFFMYFVYITLMYFALLPF